LKPAFEYLYGCCQHIFTFASARLAPFAGVKLTPGFEGNRPSREECTTEAVLLTAAMVQQPTEKIY
jgi:hypothetical protein